MFGAIRVRAGDLLVREQEYYRATYCGLCRAHGRCTGQCSRYFLSYDMTFLAVIRSVLAGIQPELEQKRCFVHPLHRRTILKMDASVCDVAFGAAILNAYKNIDDWKDERGGKRLRAILLRPLLAGGKHRAERKYSELGAVVREKLDQLSELEQHPIPSADAYAEVFGSLMGEILSFGLEQPSARIGYTIGFHLGKWVYLLDAVNDFDEDMRKGRFNPLEHLFGTQELSLEQKQEIRIAMTAELMAAETAFDLLTYRGNGDERRGIIRNVLYFGMPDAMDLALGEIDQKHKGVKNRDRSV